ncbi:glycosyltransferase family 2 protein [Shimia sp. FJ5]|uniref:glycosyltransferase family 2 protein n=1 Tax=Shimia sp. FJ5 TaxID=3079054 RepID=UPI002610A23D|nr:glycosyltransferase family 2 protein [Shimia sp. FJ5]MDV4146149.1 glycosyltransferase family 2 protein [Shimia sp. FJ5]
MPRFSIILPFHAAAQTIAATIHSLQAQTFENWELICINDRTPDQSGEIVAAMALRDPRIRLVVSPAFGPSEARNHGAKIARSDLIAFCDADDLWADRKLEELDRAFRAPEVAGIFGRIGFFCETPADSRTQSTVPSGALTIPQLLAENPVCTMSNLTLRRDIFLAAGGLDPDAVHNEDLELLIRLVGLGYRIEGLKSLQVWYRTVVTGLSADLPAMFAGRQRALRTAARFGVHASSESEAVYMRYLARRALRVGATPHDALRYTLAGVRQDPVAFLLPARRGLATALASVLAFVLTQKQRHVLFSR